MSQNFDWIPEGTLRNEIIQAWEDYHLRPETWRLYHYLYLVALVPIEDIEEEKYTRYYVRFGDSHQELPLD